MGVWINVTKKSSFEAGICDFSNVCLKIGTV